MATGKLPTPGGTPKMPKMAIPRAPATPKPAGTVRGMPNMGRAAVPRVPRVPKV